MCMACGASSGSETGSHPPVPLNRRLLLGGLGGAALVGLAGRASADGPRDAAAVSDTAQAIGDAKLGLVLLGTQAGPPVVADRAGISSALVVDGQVYVVDCGRSTVTSACGPGWSSSGSTRSSSPTCTPTTSPTTTTSSCWPGTSPT